MNSRQPFVKILLYVAIAIFVVSAIYRISSLRDLLQEPQNYSYGTKGITGENMNVYSSTDSTVAYKPVCPECGHINGMYIAEVTAGEDHSTTHMCNKCYAIFDITINR